MPKGIQSKTGDAPITRQGHTATGNHGDDPNLRGGGKAMRKPRDLRVK